MFKELIYDSEKQLIAQTFLNKANEIGSIPLAEGVETGLTLNG